jgi:hypothetical protein
MLVVPHRIYIGAYLNHVSGSLAVLGDDLAHGILYRPLFSELGYGGSRNFPLHVTVHGLLIAAGIPIRTAGHLVSLAAGGGIVAASAKALRALGATAKYAWTAGVLPLASRTAVMGIAGIRADLLPVCLGLWGIALLPRSDRRSVFPAAFFFGLCLLAKPTLFWAPGGAMFSLLLARRYGSAIKLTLFSGAVVSAGFAAAIVASGGQILTSLHACATGGGLKLSFLVGALAFVRPGDVMWIFGGVALTLLAGRRGLSEPAGFACLLCLPATLFVLSSRGTHVNHLVDSSVIGSLAIAVATWRAGSSTQLPAIMLLIGTSLGLLEVTFLSGVLVQRGDFEQAALAVPPGRDPMLAEQPWIPLQAGERPFLLDGFSLLLIRKTSPAIDRDFLTRLDRCGFRAVVLLGRAETSGPWYDKVTFGTGFREHLLDHYWLDRVVGGQAIYLPRCSAPTFHPNKVVEGETALEREQRPSPARALLNSLRGR